MKKKIFWFLFAALSIIIGLYPLQYLLMAGKVGILNSKPDWLLTNVIWNVAFYIHIVLGGLSLLIGWIQFSSKLRAKNLSMHRQIGKVYVVSVLLSSISGFYIALFANEGIWTSLGFSCLAVIWFYTTLGAYVAIRNKQILQHQMLMIYSYASCFAAVTLRIWLPILIIIIGNYRTAYIMVAWWSWIPNLFIAYLITKRLTRKSNQTWSILKKPESI
jgi:uncharacterized membrane protein